METPEDYKIPYLENKKHPRHTPETHFSPETEYLMKNFHCSAPNALGFFEFLKQTKEGNWNKAMLKEYCEQDGEIRKSVKEEFEQFRQNFALYHEKTQ